MEISHFASKLKAVMSELSLVHLVLISLPANSFNSRSVTTARRTNILLNSSFSHCV